MVNLHIANNAAHLEQELDWLHRLIEFRMVRHFGQDVMASSEEDRNASALVNEYSPLNDIYDLELPGLPGPASAYSALVDELELDFDARALMALAFVPHLRPEMLDIFRLKNKGTDRGFTEFGGTTGKNHPGFLPTAETFLFILGGDNLERRIRLNKLFGSEHIFTKKNIITLEGPQENEPHTSGIITLSRDILELCTTGEKHKPVFGKDFPAKLVETGMSWDDLVLNHSTLSQINDLRIWLRYHGTMMEALNMHRKVKPGYKVLFHGPPGTGKTLTACLLGQETEKDVYRVDLSMVVSKYIGETEKNLAKIFDKAEHSGWILFFDEADALFGSRTKVESSHDRYANQEVSYLLQRIEDYAGLVILASNLKNNIDHAFLRRFQSIVHFPHPRAEERHLLWQKSFPEQILLSGGISLKQLAQDHELTGAHIINIVSHCTLHALANGNNEVTPKMLRDSIARELAKEGRTI
jgi:hypothetical protein